MSPHTHRVFKDLRSGEYFVGYWYNTFNVGWQVKVAQDGFTTQESAQAAIEEAGHG